jgi:hypothetical protein
LSFQEKLDKTKKDTKGDENIRYLKVARTRFGLPPFGVADRPLCLPKVLTFKHEIILPVLA